LHPELTKKLKKGSKRILLLWSCRSRQKEKGREHPLGGQGCTGETVRTCEAKQGPYRSLCNRETSKPAAHRPPEPNEAGGTRAFKKPGSIRANMREAFCYLLQRCLKSTPSKGRRKGYFIPGGFVKVKNKQTVSCETFKPEVLCVRRTGVVPRSPKLRLRRPQRPGAALFTVSASTE